jgi:small subunit ribosomal protein S7
MNKKIQIKKTDKDPKRKSNIISNLYIKSDVLDNLISGEHTNSIIWNRKEKFINLLIKDGKKTKASKLFFEMLWFLKKRIPGQTSFVLNLVQGRDFTGDKSISKPENFSKSSFSYLSTLYYFSLALQNVMPTLEVRKVRVSGSTYLVPAILYKKRQESLAMKWIIEAAKKKQKSSKSNFAQCLADEVYDASKKLGQARQKRDDLHRLAQANRAYMRYRWW